MYMYVYNIIYLNIYAFEQADIRMHSLLIRKNVEKKITLYFKINIKKKQSSFNKYFINMINYSSSFFFLLFYFTITTENNESLPFVSLNFFSSHLRHGLLF